LIKAIVAVSPQGILAVDGVIPWRKPEDLKRFKAKTLGSTLIMGRKTWESIGSKPLPGRRTVILSRSLVISDNRALVAASLDQAFQMARDPYWGSRDNLEVWLVGGAEVYEQCLHLIDSFDVTVVTDYRLDPLPEKGLTLFKSFVENLEGFKEVHRLVNKSDPTLTHIRFQR